MKKILGLSICLFAGSAHAGLITTDTTSITSSGQSYSTSAALSSSYTNVVLDITAKGDYGFSSNENIQFSIDGNLLADMTYNTPGISVTNNYEAYDYTLITSIAISAPLWALMAADNNLNISWINGNSVNPYPSEGGADFVTYTLSGDLVGTPEPFSFGLLSLGLVAVGLSRKKKAA